MACATTTTNGTFKMSYCADCRQIVTWLDHIIHIWPISHVVIPVNKMADLFGHQFSELHLSQLYFLNPRYLSHSCFSILCQNLMVK